MSDRTKGANKESKADQEVIQDENDKTDEMEEMRAKESLIIRNLVPHRLVRLVPDYIGPASLTQLEEIEPHLLSIIDQQKNN